MTIGIGGGLSFGAGLFAGAIPMVYPLINGYRPSWASIEFKFNGTIVVAINKAKYGAKRTRTQPYGTNVNPLAKTRGKIAYNGNVTWLLTEYYNFIGILGAADPTGQNSYGDAFFGVDITYQDTGGGIIHDQLLGCTIDEDDSAHTEGAETLMVTTDLAPLLVLRNGQPMSSQPLAAPSFP